MRTYRFVRFLGETVDAVGREVSDVAAGLARERDAGQLPVEREPADAFAHRVAREFPRRIASRLDGAGKGGVAVTARVVAGSDGGEATADLGVVLAIDLPEYRHVAAVLAECRTWAAPDERDRYDVMGRGTDAHDLGTDATGPGTDTSDLAGVCDHMLAHTNDSYVFALPVDGGVAVVPAAAVSAVEAAGEPVPATFPHDLYARSVGRFTEEFAEGFVGDGTIAPALSPAEEWPAIDLELRAFQREYGVRDVLYLAVSAAEDGAVPTLGDFVGE